VSASNGDNHDAEQTTRALAPANASHEAPTRVTSATSPSSGTDKTITSVADVLEDEERARTRLLGKAGFGVNVLGLGVLPLFGGTPLARMAFLLGLLIHAGSNLGLYYVARSPTRFTERWLMLLWCASFVGLHLVIYYLSLATI
jgi:hypothetical protein